MKKIFINTPYASDANSFWRCMGPMSYLAKNSDFQIFCPTPNTSFQWDTVAQFDCIFMHRPCRADDLKLLKMAKVLNIPVWSDYDDWLFDLPSWNPNKDAYDQGAVQHVMAMAIACSDIVTVSTEALQKKFSKVNPNVVILPNAYRTDLVPFREKTAPPRKELFFWRGTNTHDGDLLSVKEAFPILTQPVLFMGSPSYQLLSTMHPDFVQKQKHVDTILYWRMLYETAAKVMLFPLEDCFFNQCKSNIAWIEAIHSGAIIVAPKMDEWIQPGVVTYTPGDSDSFHQAAEEAMALDSNKISMINTEAYDYMVKLYGIKTINQIRISILESLFYSSPSLQRSMRDPFQELTGVWALSVLKGTELPKP